MKKIISAALAGAMCMGAFVSCGDKKETGKSGGALSAKGKSEYVSIMPLDGNRQSLNESIDSGIKYSINRAKAYRKENDTEYNPWVIEFSGNKFVMPIELSKYWKYYDGTFSVKNGEIKFSYKNFIVPDNDTKINIDNNPDDAENFRAAEAAIDRMQKLNETGSYCRFSVPSMNTSDKWSDFTLLPFIRYTRGTEMNMECSNTLKTVDKFLCTDTYGIELKGKYKRGKDFTLEHDLEETMEEDEQSPFNWESNAKEYKDRVEERAEMNYGCDSLESTIKFSDGEWEWYNDDGKLLNNGKYEESKKYHGLIKMYIDEDSEKCPKYAENTFPLLFYIDNDGKIYYPAFVKVE